MAMTRPTTVSRRRVVIFRIRVSRTGTFAYDVALLHRRPHGALVGGEMIGHAEEVRAVCVYHVDVEVAGGVGGEGDAGPVRRPGREAGGRAIVGEAGLVGAVRVHDVNFAVAIASGGECDERAVGR